MSRKTIEQRIALQGGQEIIAELRNLGDAGERAFRQIADAAQRAGSPGAQLGRAIGNLKKELVSLGQAGQRLRTQFNAVRGSLNNVAASFRSVALRTVAISAAVVGTGAALVAFTAASTEAADAAGKTAAALGLTVESFGRLQFAASQSGVAQSQFERGITRLSVLLADAAAGTERAVDQFNRLGVSFRDASGALRPTEDVLGDIAEAFARLPDGAEKSALAVELFGQRAGPQFVNLLNGGREGLRALGDEAERLGLVFTKEQTVIAAAFQDSLDALRRTLSGLRNQVGLLFAPALTQGSNALIEIINDNRAAIQSFISGVVDRATPIFEDFVALLTGRDGDVQNTFLIEARDAVVEFGAATREAVFGIVIPAYEALIAAGGAAATAINAVFGSAITGEQLLIAAVILQFTGALRALLAVAGLAVNSIRLLIASVALIKPGFAVAAAAFAVLKAGIIAATAAVAGLLSVPGAVVTAVALAIAAVIIYWEDIVRIAQASIAEIVRVLGRIAEGARAAFQALVEAAGDAWTRVRQIVGDGLSAIWTRMREAGVAVWDAFRSAAEGAVSFVSRQLDRLRAAIDRIRTALARLRSASSGGRNDARGASADGFATGGRVRGPGTGTSDSIPAWLSDGEWVIRAKAVRHYGHGLLAAINSMRIPRDAITRRKKDDLPRFATGGRVDRAALPKFPAFATGGPVDVSVQSPAMKLARLAVSFPKFPAVPAPQRVAVASPVVNVARQALNLQAAPAALSAPPVHVSVSSPAIHLARRAVSRPPERDEPRFGFPRLAAFWPKIPGVARVPRPAALSVAAAAAPAFRFPRLSWPTIPGFSSGGPVDARHFSLAAPRLASGGPVPRVSIPMPKFPAFISGGSGGAAPAFRFPRLSWPTIPGFSSGGPVDARHFSLAAPRLASGGPVPRISIPIPKFPAFAVGGPVIVANLMRGFEQAMSFPMPRFAEGGAVAGTPSGRPVMLNIAGQEFGPMRAEDDVIEQISRFAAQRQVASLGRRPGWYGK